MSKGHIEALAVLKGRRVSNVTKIVTGPRGELIVPPGVTMHIGSGTLPSRPQPGTKCPTCGSKVPKRQSAAERQRASRDRKKAKA